MQNNDKTKTVTAGGAGIGILSVGGFFYGSSASAITAKLAIVGLGSMTTGLVLISGVPLVTAGVAYIVYKNVKKYQNKQD